VLFGTDRILAARMGLVFSAAGAAGMAALGYWSDVGRGAYVGAALQLVLCCVAAGLLIRAKRRVESLARRRRELESRMASPHSGHQR
jgi:hypothetical protein